MRRFLATTAIAAVVVTMSIGSTRGAPITFNTALPVGGGEFVARGQIVVSQSGDDPTAANRDHTATSFISVLGYGIDHKFAVFGVLPFVQKDLDLDIAGSRTNRNATGFGDLALFGRYTIVQRDSPGRTFRVAPFAGFTAPIGDSNKSDNLGRLPPSVQPGSGAWNGFAGIVATYQTFAVQVDGQLSYRINNEANSFDPANEFRIDGSMQYRLWPETLGDGVPSFLFGVLEANLVYRGKNKINGIDDNDSGGTTLYLSPGLQYVTKRWIAEGIVQLPVMQNLNSNALESDYVLRAGVRFNF